LFAASGWATQAHAANAQFCLADDYRSSLPHTTINFLAGMKGASTLKWSRKEAREVPLPLANSYPASAISFPLTSITHRRKTKRTQFGAAPS
jgi:hypothetical protein